MADVEENNSEEQGQASCQETLLYNTGTNSSTSSSIKITKGLSRGEKPLILATKSETCFGHFSGGSLYCSHLKTLQKQLLTCTELKLTQECLKRYACALNFTKKLETYVEHEFSRLNGIYCHELSKNRRLNLDYYHKICKEAKVHLNHWQRLEYKIGQQPLPFRHIVVLRLRIQKFRYSFMCLRSKILYWLHMIAVAGIRVLANASFKQLSSTVDLQNFLQGIEEYNHIVSLEEKQSCDMRDLYSFNSKGRLPALNSSLPNLSIVEILSTISIERSKLLAKLTHEHFVQEAKAVELQDFLSTTRFSWNSDGHLSTQDLLECTASVRYGKLQSVIKKYSHKEEEFIKQLLGTASVCAVFHQENEIKRRSVEFFQEKNQQYACECNPTQAKCLACQMKKISIKSVMDGSEYSELSEASPPEDHGSNQDLRALFMESKPTKAKCQLFALYRDNLWSRFGLEFYNALESLSWPYVGNMSIGAVCCWSTAVIIGIMQHFDNLATTGPFTEVGVKSVRHVSHSLYLRSVLSGLDGLHCLMIAVGQQDKCKPSSAIVDGVSCTKTVSLMVQACTLFQHFFDTVSHWEEFATGDTSLHSSLSITVRIEDVFNKFGLFLNYCIFWFTTKVKRFLASWSLPSFFLVAQYELSILMKSINTTLQLMEQMHCQLGYVSNHAMALKFFWDEMERKAGFLQIIEVESWENFKHKFITLASEFWQEMMPKSRVWKRSRNSGSLPSEPSSYVEHAIIQVLQPVIEGVSQLPQGLQNAILVQAVEIMMDTWSSYILKEQIKFSVIGAYQLQVDFNYVKLWLTSDASTLSGSVQSDLAILDVFRHLNEAVRLLLIQPKNKRKRIVVSENGLDPELESNLSTISGSSALSGTSSYDGEVELLNNQLIPNKEQWLNLRLRKGKSRIPLVIPGCLRSPEQT